MGRMWSKLARPIKNINVENRAQKQMDNIGRSNIGKAAPRHPSSVEALDQFAKEHPELLDKQKQKDEALLDKLKNVHVESYGPPPEIRSIRNEMPQKFAPHPEPEFGIQEPERITPGKTSIRLALQFLAEHQAAPEERTAVAIAAEYKLDVHVVEQILKYYKPLHLHMPKALREKYPNIMDSLGDVKTFTQDPKQYLNAQTKTNPSNS